MPAEKGLRDPLRENVWKLLNWTSSRVAKQPVVSLRNKTSEKRALMMTRTIQIWEELLNGWKFVLPN